jgi:hypothetical protein
VPFSAYRIWTWFSDNLCIDGLSGGGDGGVRGGDNGGGAEEEEQSDTENSE